MKWLFRLPGGDGQGGGGLASIGDSLVAIRRALDADYSESLDQALRRVEEVGGAIGRLQVGCCAPHLRMPL